MTSAPAISLLRRLSIVPPVLLLVAVIAHGAFGVGRDTTPRIHSLRNAEACLECHRGYDDYALVEPDVCSRCHVLEGATHADLPGGAATPDSCTRCHDPHGKTREPFLLRREAARDAAADSAPRGR